MQKMFFFLTNLPRGSRTVSAEPKLPATTENLQTDVEGIEFQF